MPKTPPKRTGAADDGGVPLFVVRLVAQTVGGLLLIPAAITKIALFAQIGVVVLLLCSVVAVDTFRHWREGAAMLPPMVGFGPCFVFAGVGAGAHWAYVPQIGLVAGGLNLLQIAVNFPDPRAEKKAQAQLAAALAAKHAEPAAEETPQQEQSHGPA